MDAAQLQRFEAKFAPEPNTGCWLWFGCTDKRLGYGTVRDGAKNRKAHRVSYEHFIGAIPDGLEIDHVCRVRNCVNPDHLQAITHTENVRRSVRKINTHCAYGHEFTVENTCIAMSGKRRGRRYCKECNRRNSREYYRESVKAQG